MPCVSHGRWPIAYVLAWLAASVPVEQMTQSYPELTLADIQMALEAAAWVLRDPAIDWSTLDLPGMVDVQHELTGWQNLSDEALSFDDGSLKD